MPMKFGVSKSAGRSVMTMPAAEEKISWCFSISMMSLNLVTDQ